MESKLKSQSFSQTYAYYLDQIRKLSIVDFGQRMDIDVDDDIAMVPLFGKICYISHSGFTNVSGQPLDFSTCVVLSKYLIMSPDVHPQPGNWVAYREFPDAAPLRDYFSNEVERMISRIYAGRARQLNDDCLSIGGRPVEMGNSSDVSMEILALPKIPLLLIFYDQDNQFPASCSVLFRKSAQIYLDAESLAILANLLVKHLQADK